MRTVFPRQTSSQFLDDLATDMNSLVETFFGDVPVGERTRGDQKRSAMRVPLDVEESNEAFFVSLDVPGIANDAIEIDVHEDTLTVKGSRVLGDVSIASPDGNSETHQPASVDKLESEEAADRARKIRKRERSAGDFQRVVRFSVPIDAEKVSAELAEGVLVISLPKADPNRGKRRIPVSKV